MACKRLLHGADGDPGVCRQIPHRHRLGPVSAEPVEEILDDDPFARRLIPRRRRLTEEVFADSCQQRGFGQRNSGGERGRQSVAARSGLVMEPSKPERCADDLPSAPAGKHPAGNGGSRRPVALKPLVQRPIRKIDDETARRGGNEAHRPAGRTNTASPGDVDSGRPSMTMSMPPDSGTIT